MAVSPSSASSAASLAAVSSSRPSRQPHELTPFTLPPSLGLASLQTYAQQLHALLEQTTAPDTAVIQNVRPACFGASRRLLQAAPATLCARACGLNLLRLAPNARSPPPPRPTGYDAAQHDLLQDGRVHPRPVRDPRDLAQHCRTSSRPPVQRRPPAQATCARVRRLKSCARGLTDDDTRTLVSPCPLQVRQLAAVELRKRVISKDGKMWQAVPVEIRAQIKANSLEAVLKEERRVLLSSATTRPSASQSPDLVSSSAHPAALLSATRARASSRPSPRSSSRSCRPSGPSSCPSSTSSRSRPTRPTAASATSSCTPCSTRSPSVSSRSCPRCSRSSARVSTTLSRSRSASPPSGACPFSPCLSSHLCASCPAG